MKKITIAIDGYSSCGKSTLAKDLARKLGYSFIDSGAMYRAVTLFFIRGNYLDVNDPGSILKILDSINLGFKFNPAKGISEIYLNGENVENEIREMPVSENVSKVSAIAEVRKKLVDIQKEIGKNKGVVMDGRDIGTVVFPDAELKIFMTASNEIRTGRRFEELKLKGMNVSKEEIQKNLEQRDYEDTHRKESPLTKAADAIVLDNSEMNREEQLGFALDCASERNHT